MYIYYFVDRKSKEPRENRVKLRNPVRTFTLVYNTRDLCYYRRRVSRYYTGTLSSSIEKSVCQLPEKSVNQNLAAECIFNFNFTYVNKC
jgi:hypothetical protein